jgi:subtilase family serine protease
MKHNSAMLVIFAGAALMSAAPRARLHGSIDNSQTFVLEGHRSALLASAQDLGESNPSLALPQLELHFKMSPAQAADLNTLLASQRDRNSKWYHKWLTPEQFGDRFGVNESDLKKVKEWLENAGFANVQMSRSRTFLQMSGTAADVNNLFGVAIHQYRRSGKEFYASAADPVFPRALEGLVSGLKGMTNNRVRPFVRRIPNPQISVGINGNHFLGPDDLATIYNLHTLYSQGTDGTGQTIAVVGQSDISLSDIEAFQTTVGLPIKDPQVILAGNDPGSDPDNTSEADLDLEWTGAVARGATILYVNSPDALGSAQYAIENNLAPIVSISYGLCEAALTPSEMEFFNVVFQQANAQGITVVAASGDQGAAACDDNQDASGTPETAARFGLAVNFPASSPYVTALGGTEFVDAQGSFWNSSGRATSYIPEMVWNDTPTEKVLSGSGGGASKEFTKPAWQLGSGVPSDGQRDVPDIALSASPVHDAYFICTGGSCSNGLAPPVNQIYFVGGTSCAAPVFSGMLALLNQSSGGPQGNVNPAMYALASFTSGVFHDVELGDNRVPCVVGTADCDKSGIGFSAGPGYDQATGLGSIDATQLIEQWGSDFQLALSPNFISITAGTTGNADIRVTRFAHFAGNVSFSCSVASSLTNTTCSIPGVVSGSGLAVLTITNTSTNLGTSQHGMRSVPPGFAMLLVIVSAGLLLWTGRRRSVVYAGFAALCLLTVTSCGSGDSEGTSISTGSKALTGNVTVTATSGVLVRVITVPVTIS